MSLWQVTVRRVQGLGVSLGLGFRRPFLLPFEGSGVLDFGGGVHASRAAGCRAFGVRGPTGFGWRTAGFGPTEAQACEVQDPSFSV